VGLRILLLNSFVCHGHVGASAQLFPLQRLGAEVTVIPTVRFSNHPGYGHFAGDVTSPNEIARLVEGLEAIGALDALDGLLSGYLSDPRTGAAAIAAITRARQRSPAALYACDPVLGDNGRLYVVPGVDELLRGQAVPGADFITPNLFELGLLTGLPCGSLTAVKRAATALQAEMRAAGPRAVLVTGLRLETTPKDAVDMLLAEGGAFHRLRTPFFDLTANGTGDLAAALFLHEYLRLGDGAAALAAMAARLVPVLRLTAARGARELALVAAQDEFAAPPRQFQVEQC